MKSNYDSRFAFKIGDRVGRLMVRGLPEHGHGPMAGTVIKIVKKCLSGRATATVRVKWDSGREASHENVQLTLFSPDTIAKRQT